MEEMELIAFQMISQAGSARSSFMEALMHARAGQFDGAKEKLAEAAEQLSEAHKVHAGLIQQEAAGNKTVITLLILHAEDLLMTTETMGELAKEFVYMYREFRK
ncbi:PTS lactose/cellobiose transporter subunit IIA [Metabacillus sp. GX 13764]|uniref:PTS lactose/cellobiose transporter subunit IIA n=1 Tax=Metabacillus kandeliae TaxID=2900151 RepID=UPI001E43F2C5|nr:PTS lactose/cellobiose transporter subunit IIA [Metabacillus kandeliae]MCD7035061.1 PTS lactose/cellobiose transporter subunit IIA [Metabacillus kandeliae]